MPVSNSEKTIVTSRLHELTLRGPVAKVGAGETAHGIVAPQVADGYLLPPQAHLREFLDIFYHRRLTAVFQPILDFRQHRYLGYEGLIRGPAGSPLESPPILLTLAQQCGLGMEFERLCRETILANFAALDLRGDLFINVSIGCLSDPFFLNGETARLLDALRLRAGRIVIELTENQEAGDFAALREILQHYRSLGYRIAIDDLGEGFSNLRMWSEISPEFVKIDRHFIRTIADDPLKFHLVRAIRDIAESSHAQIIAEGIESESEFATVRDLGIAHGQGYLIARPCASPMPDPSNDVAALLGRRGVIVFPQAVPAGAATARQVLQQVRPIGPDTLNQSVYERFEQAPGEVVLPVVAADGTPLGLINRHSLIDRFARPFRRELYGKRACTMFMNAAPIVVDHSLPVQEIGRLLGSSDHHQLLDGFIITENGRYLGIGSSQTLMTLITEMQIRAARYANPLTQLPGNVPIHEHIDRLLNNGAGFVACHCDLDHFKPYNDCYGYRAGDQIIQLLGRLLADACHPHLDFVGHIGGDDFMLVMQSENWEARTREALKRFDTEVLPHLDPAHVRCGGYDGEDRKGHSVFHPLPALSIGALQVMPEQFHSHHEVSAAVCEAKKQAKKLPGSALFVERRLS
jgi:EAL domain-containing protein (putative c-di-GMP-specific phosphodiesterase class I)/GGDEF domain-containing protein